MTNQERTKILEMFASGKLTIEQADHYWKDSALKALLMRRSGQTRDSEQRDSPISQESNFPLDVYSFVWKRRWCSSVYWSRCSELLHPGGGTTLEATFVNVAPSGH